MAIWRKIEKEDGYKCISKGKTGTSNMKKIPWEHSYAYFKPELDQAFKPQESHQEIPTILCHMKINKNISYNKTNSKINLKI